MKPDLIKSFVTYYLQGLNERTRREKSGTKWGIDWVAYNIGLARFGKPVRMPFLRRGEGGYPKSKVEAEFGVDVAFLSEDRHRLVIFVLKDEPLTNATWTKNDFDRDLRMAAAPDLAAEGLGEVTSVTVILAYNKDDEQNGVEAYERLVRTFPSVVKGNISLTFLRWNLSDLVEQTTQHILSPALLPERFFGQLTYISAQALDFRHGSDPWRQQLIPNWRRFVKDVLAESAGSRGATLMPVALIIIRNHAEANGSIETGWIELVEWAAIALWEMWETRREPETQDAIKRFWCDLYIEELDRFYREHMAELKIEQSIDQLARGSFVGAVAASHVAYWHLAHLGLLSLHVAESANPQGGDADTGWTTRLQEIANWTAEIVNANVAVFRPVVDIQHIEIFLLAALFRNADRTPEIAAVLGGLQERLYFRRLGHGDLPFLDGSNSFEHVLEQVASRPDEPLVLSQSSFFVLMLLELCCILPDESRDELLTRIHSRLVLGAIDRGDPGENRHLDLISWIPPRDWARKVWAGTMEESQSVAVPPLATSREATASEILANLRRVVSQMRQVDRLELPNDIPLAALILACWRHHTPLPPELWRRWAFHRLP